MTSKIDTIIVGRVVFRRPAVDAGAKIGAAAGGGGKHPAGGSEDRREVDEDGKAE